MTKFLLTAAIAALAIPAAANAQPHGGKADANGDGVVTLAEHQAKVAEHFAKLDADGNGQVTQAEMKAMHEARMERRGERMEKRAERMSERKAKMEEKLAQMSAEERAEWEAHMEKRRAHRAEGKQLRGEHRAMRHEAMWEKADSDGNGAISLAEFQAHAGERFAKMDANGNGQIDTDEKPKRRKHRGMGGKR